MASETDHGAHEAHAHGLAALMGTEAFPLDISGIVRSSQVQILYKNVRVSKAALRKISK